MDYPGFLHQQVAAIVEQYFADYNIAWIGVPDLEWLTRRQSMDGGMVVTLPGYAWNEALVWRDKQSRRELWVRPVDKSVTKDSLYRDAWTAFTRLCAGTSVMTELNGREFQVDHLYPETAGARLGLSHVRMMPVDARPNRTVGSTVERAAAGPKPGMLRPRFATPFTLAKVSGFQPSMAKRFGTREVARALWDHLRACGYPVPQGSIGQLDADLTASTLEWFRGL